MRTAGPPSVSVVIPSWNGREQLEGVLESLEAQEYDDFETIVVDNGSSDGSVEYLAERWPRGQGPGAGGEPRVRRRRQPRDRGERERVRRPAQQRRRAGARLAGGDDGGRCGARRRPDRSPRSCSSGHGATSSTAPATWWAGTATASAGARASGTGASTTGRRGCSRPAPRRRCTGAGRCEEVGPFDERFFAYIEDVDWGLRAQLAGWNCFYEHDRGRLPRRRGVELADRRASSSSSVIATSC